jgi:1-acyl-sn-glycerol-3-phosphate acyltransferase
MAEPESAPSPRPVASGDTTRRPPRHRLLGRTPVRTVLSIWSWFVLGVVVIVWTPLVGLVRLVTLPFDRGAYAAGYLFRKQTVVHQVLNPLWTFRTSGTMITDPRRPYVVIANHQSFVDILLISHLPWEMKWLSKQTFFKIPLVGWMMRMAGDIRLVRGEKDSVIAAMNACRDRLDKRVSVMIFPEGTRSRDGHLQPFKDGAFRLAIEQQVPVLPLAVNGAYTALIKGDWRLGVSDAEVRVLEPIETEGMTLDDLPTLKAEAHRRIDAAVEAMRAEYQAAGPMTSSDAA